MYGSTQIQNKEKNTYLDLVLAPMVPVNMKMARLLTLSQYLMQKNKSIKNSWLIKQYSKIWD